VSDRHARFEALLPPGVRSRFRSVALARAGPPSRCSRGLLPLQSSLHLGSGSGFSRLHTQQGEALYHVRLREVSRLATLLRDPTSDARASCTRDPPACSGRSNPARHRQAATLLHGCFANTRDASRQPHVHVAAHAKAICPCPFRRHPAPSAPFTPPYPHKRCVTLDLEDAFLNRRPAFAPHGADGCLTPREVSQIPRCRVDHDPRA